MSHLRARRSSGVSAITLISVLGVLVGVTALIMVLAVMEGFELDLRDKILGSNAHVVILNYNGTFADYEDALEKVRGVKGVTAAAPFVYQEAMLRSSMGTSGCIVLKGLDPENTGQVTDIVSNMKVGPAGALASREEKQAVIDNLHSPSRGMAQDPTDEDELPGIVIGEELANMLKVYPGDRVQLVNPIGGGTGPMGLPTPKVEPYRIAGVFYSGMYEYDTKWTYVTNDDAQSFARSGDVITGIEAKVDDIEGVDPIALQIEDELQFPFFVRHWKNLNRNLFSALKLEKIVMGLILSLIVGVASLNIAGTLIILVLTRGREISILRAMGASTTHIRSIFMLEGLLIGSVGSAIGTVLGLIGCYALDRYQFPLDTDVYYLDTLPVVVEPSTVVVVALSAIAISFLATLYPASMAARIDPVEGLRYE